jgi:catechol 2,3-dioxygenase
VHLGVTDRDHALAVWRDLVGLTVLGETDKTIDLGAGADILVVLHIDADKPVAPDTSGRYHVAIHVPTRRDLAIAIARLFRNRFRNAPTDHLVTETTYLWDLDGNGIELTFETPWRGRLVTDGEGFYGIDTAGRRHSGREAVDLDSLFGELSETDDLNAKLPPGTRVGHVHLHVADLDEAMAFYAGIVGFARQMLSRDFRMGDVTLDYPPHILAFNTWAGEGAKQAPAGHAGLRWFTIDVPDAAAMDALRLRLAKSGHAVDEVDGGLETTDPAGNRLQITLGKSK